MNRLLQFLSGCVPMKKINADVIEHYVKMEDNHVDDILEKNSRI
jgi:hypothetical protein